MANKITEVTKRAHAAASQARKESHQRLVAALKEARGPGKLTEAKRTQLGESIVREAIVYERAGLLEAAGPDPQAAAQSFQAMLGALDQLATRTGSPQLAAAHEKLAAAAPDDPADATADPRRWAGFQKALADAAVLTKGLNALADAVDDPSSDLGGMLRSSQSLSGGSHADTIGVLLRRLDPSGGRAPQGRLARFMSATKDPADRFRAGVKLALSKAAGIDRHIKPDALAADLMKLPVGRFLGALRNYGYAVAEGVSPDMLTQMTKTSLLGAVKNMFGGMGGGVGGGSRLGAGARALQPLRERVERFTESFFGVDNPVADGLGPASVESFVQIGERCPQFSQRVEQVFADPDGFSTCSARAVPGLANIGLFVIHGLTLPHQPARCTVPRKFAGRCNVGARVVKWSHGGKEATQKEATMPNKKSPTVTPAPVSEPTREAKEFDWNTMYGLDTDNERCARAADKYLHDITMWYNMRQDFKSDSTDFEHKSDFVFTDHGWAVEFVHTKAGVPDQDPLAYYRGFRQTWEMLGNDLRAFLAGWKCRERQAELDAIETRNAACRKGKEFDPTPVLKHHHDPDLLPMLAEVVKAYRPKNRQTLCPSDIAACGMVLTHWDEGFSRADIDFIGWWRTLCAAAARIGDIDVELHGKHSYELEREQEEQIGRVRVAVEYAVRDLRDQRAEAERVARNAKYVTRGW